MKDAASRRPATRWHHLLPLNAQLHAVNMQWPLKAEQDLWTPETQQVKRSEGGIFNLRYKGAWKRQWLRASRNSWLTSCLLRRAVRLLTPLSRSRPQWGDRAGIVVPLPVSLPRGPSEGLLLWHTSAALGETRLVPREMFHAARHRGGPASARDRTEAAADRQRRIRQPIKVSPSTEPSHLDHEIPHAIVNSIGCGPSLDYEPAALR